MLLDVAHGCAGFASTVFQEVLCGGGVGLCLCHEKRAAMLQWVRAMRHAACNMIDMMFMVAGLKIALP